ncbi:MAG: ABC transporter permease [Saprospiraceae bacterium]
MNYISLFKTEIKKFKNNSTVVLLFTVFSLLMPFVILLGKSILKKDSGPLPSSQILYEFPTVWDYQGYVGNWLVFFFLGFMVLHMYNSEISYKTMRQNIIAGYTKWEYYIGKVVGVLLLSIYATLIYTISSSIMGMISTPGFDMDLMIDSNYAPLRFFLMTLGYLSFAFLVATIFKKGGLSMFFYFSYALILESILRYGYLYFVKHQSANYFPLNAIEDNMTFPLIRSSNDFFNTNYDFELVNSFVIAGGLSLFYTIVFFVLAWYRIKKTDI